MVEERVVVWVRGRGILFVGLVGGTRVVSIGWLGRDDGRFGMF